MANYTRDGLEVPDQRKVSLPHGWERPESLQDSIKRLIRVQLSAQAVADDMESFEDADDFDIDEDPDLISPYEVREAAPEAPGGVKDVDADPPPHPSLKAAPEPAIPVPPTPAEVPKT